MDMFKEEQFATLHLGHLGLVASKIDSLKLIELIDRRLPITPGCQSKVSHGERGQRLVVNVNDVLRKMDFGVRNVRL